MNTVQESTHLQSHLVDAVMHKYNLKNTILREDNGQLLLCIKLIYLKLAQSLKIDPSSESLSLSDDDSAGSESYNT